MQHLRESLAKTEQLLVEPEVLQVQHHGVDSEEVLGLPALGLFVAAGPRDRPADHSSGERPWDIRDAQALPLRGVLQDVVH